MKTISTLIAVALLASTPALAQTGAKDNAAIKSAHTVNDGTARRGANSFTEVRRARTSRSPASQTFRR
ncbi:hypothetical protein [Sphingomonas oryzagri]